jgi:signal transduction histidine kinase
VCVLKDKQARQLQATHLAAIGQLAGGVAHEINTPLAAIALRTERLRKTAQEPELLALPAFRDFPRHLEAIDADVFRCKTIIASLLDFSRSRPPETRETDLNALAETAVALVGYQMKIKQVELSLRARADLPRIRADDGQLRQVIVGLLMNAFDAVGPRGHVAVETDREGDDRVSLTVVDDGPGIRPEDRDKIFTPFFTTKPVGSGMGLGLAVCHGIVTAHGGEIRIESEPGRGTHVSLVLPISGVRRAP